jgi:streptomycin 6-kinase
MERATGGRSLAGMVADGRDDEASRILCEVAARLHAPRPRSPPPASLKPLSEWFRALDPAAATHGGVLRVSAAAARELLAAPQGSAVLHGDLHHDNVLDFGPRGWLAIDPKGLVGEPAFDLANLFCNPWPPSDDRERFERRLLTVSAATGFDPRRLRRWVAAYAGLSAAWTLASGMPPGGPWRALRIAEMAAAGA